MAPDSLSERLWRNLYLKPYLSDLSALLGRAIGAAELSSLDELKRLAAVRSREEPTSVRSFTIAFSDKTSQRFRRYWRALDLAAPGGVYLLPPHESGCGLLRLSGLSEVPLDFPYSWSPLGTELLFLSTLNGTESICLDWFDDGDGPMLETETRGVVWPQVVY